MNLKRRSKYDIAASIRKKDLTGGYEFTPWVLYNNKKFLTGMIFNIALGCTLLTVGDHNDWVTWVVSTFFICVVPIMIILTLIRGYNKNKNGQVF